MNDVKKFEDLKGKIIAVQMGTTGAMYAEKLKSKGAVVKTFNTSDLACMELKNKGADAVVSDLPVLQYFLKNGGRASDGGRLRHRNFQEETGTGQGSGQGAGYPEEERNL